MKKHYITTKQHRWFCTDALEFKTLYSILSISSTGKRLVEFGLYDSERGQTLEQYVVYINNGNCEGSLSLSDDYVEWRENCYTTDKIIIKINDIGELFITSID